MSGLPAFCGSLTGILNIGGQKEKDKKTKNPKDKKAKRQKTQKTKRQKPKKTKKTRKRKERKEKKCKWAGGSPGVTSNYQCLPRPPPLDKG